MYVVKVVGGFVAVVRHPTRGPDARVEPLSPDHVQYPPPLRIGQGISGDLIAELDALGGVVVRNHHVNRQSVGVPPQRVLPNSTDRRDLAEEHHADGAGRPDGVHLQPGLRCDTGGKFYLEIRSLDRRGGRAGGQKLGFPGTGHEGHAGRRGRLGTGGRGGHGGAALGPSVLGAEHCCGDRHRDRGGKPAAAGTAERLRHGEYLTTKSSPVRRDRG